MPKSKSKKAATPKRQKTARHSAQPNVSETVPVSDLTLDIDRQKLDDIFFGNSDDSSNDPQESLTRLYEIVIDAFEKFFSDGVRHEFEQIFERSPLLSKVVSSGAALVDSFSKHLSHNLTKLRQSVVESVRPVEPSLNAIQHPLSSQRLNEVYQAIQAPVRDEQKAETSELESYRITIPARELGISPKMSFRVHEGFQATHEFDQLEHWIASGKVSGSQLADALTSYLTNSVDIIGLAEEATKVVEQFSEKLVHEIVENYASEYSVPTLTDALRDDPRLEDDLELQAFIQSLEGDDSDQIQSDGDDLNNDDLANLLGKIDL